MIDPPERHDDRDAAIEAMLAHVPFDGWSRKSLALGLADAGMSVDDADLLFPLGPADMVATFCDLTDRRMQAAAVGLAETRLSKRVKALIALRFIANRPHKEAIRRALGVLALPGHARVAAGCTARTVNAIWYAAGDRSADFSWYTKRAILTAVYTTTLLYWLRDRGDDDADTMAFLDRRLSDAGRLGSLRRRLISSRLISSLALS